MFLLFQAFAVEIQVIGKDFVSNFGTVNPKFHLIFLEEFILSHYLKNIYVSCLI